MYLKQRRRPRHALGAMVNSTNTKHWTLVDYSRGQIATTDPEIARRHADWLGLGWLGLLALGVAALSPSRERGHMHERGRY